MKLSTTTILSLFLGATAVTATAIPEFSGFGVPPPLMVDTSIALVLEENTDLINVTATISKRNTYTGYTTGSALQKQMLTYHNAYRAHHGAPAMTWSSTLAKAALATAKKCVFAHSDPYKYGENLGGGGSNVNNPAYFVYAWYNESKIYDYSNQGYSEGTGHFTQLVWKASTSLGCAWVVGCTGTTQPLLPNLLLCEYSPNGNMLPDSNFVTNVLKPKSTPKLPANPPAST